MRITDINATNGERKSLYFYCQDIEIDIRNINVVLRSK